MNLRRGLLLTGGAWVGLAATAAAAQASAAQGGRIQDLRLVAIGSRDGVMVAYLLEADGDVLEAKSGDRVFGDVVEVGPETLEFRGPAGTSPGARPSSGRLKLFADRRPPSPAMERGKYTGHPFSVDLDGDITSAALVFARFSGMNLALEAGTSGPVRVAARNAPWDGLLDQALKAGGFAYRIEGTYVRIGHAGRMASMRAMPEKQYSGEHITLRVREAAIEDLARVFEEVGGMPIKVPPGSHPRLTLCLDTVRSDEALELVIASMGWTRRVEGRTLVLDIPGKAP